MGVGRGWGDGTRGGGSGARGVGEEGVEGGGGRKGVGRKVGEERDVEVGGGQNLNLHNAICTCTHICHYHPLPLSSLLPPFPTSLLFPPLFPLFSCAPIDGSYHVHLTLESCTVWMVSATSSL